MSVEPSPTPCRMGEASGLDQPQDEIVDNRHNAPGWADPEKRTTRSYTITPAGQAEVFRIKAIITPKIEETIQVLQTFVADLNCQAAEAGAQGKPAA